MSRNAKIILTISLLSNFLLLGTLAGSAYRHSMHGDYKHPVRELRDQLQPDSRDLVRETFKGKSGEVRALFKEAQQKRKVLEDAYTAEEFDPVRYAAAAEDLRQVSTKIAYHKLETFKELALKLPKEDREKLGKRVTSVIIGSQDHRKWKRGDGKTDHKTDSKKEQVTDKKRDKHTDRLED